jgi:Double zinc ribbon
MALFKRLRRRAGRRSRRALPPAGAIRRERQLLLDAREDRLRDLGGLMLEMYRRDRFREDLLSDRCRELFGLDARLRELEEMLAAARRRLPVGRCDCGAPLPWNSHFCPHCGRAAGEVVVACTECGHPLAADARFCPGCGTAGAREAATGTPPAAAVATDEPVSEDTQDHAPGAGHPADGEDPVPGEEDRVPVEEAGGSAA